MDLGYITAIGINYSGTLPKIKKSVDKLRPLYEAITNSFEALRLKESDSSNQEILIKIIAIKNVFSDETQEYDFRQFEIEDNGIGFTDSEFERLISLNDNRKGFWNKGTGRVQFVHFFERSTYESIYRDSRSLTGFRKREFILSKSRPFLEKNAIIQYISNEDIEAQKGRTKLILTSPISEKDRNYYSSLTLEELKSEIINHYLAYLCENRDSLPKISLEFIVGDEVKDSKTIDKNDIPKSDYVTDFEVKYSQISADNNSIEQSNESEIFNLKSFKISTQKLPENEILLISKGEVAKNITLNNLSPKDHINNNRYLFLLSGEYIDKRDSDLRGDLKIPNKEDFKKNVNSLFAENEIIIEDIEEETNLVIEQYYSEIRKKSEEKKQNLRRLKQMFLLNDETVNSLKIGLNDSDKEILKKVYQADVKIIAQRDAEIKRQIEQIEKLKPTSKDYSKQLELKVNELVKTIPLQNRTALTHYVARRKLVLELFDKILKKQLEILEETGRIDETILHNLIFQQHSDNPSESDLWILNEEFIYFSGVSEKELRLVEIDGNKLFKEEFAEEEDKYLNSFGEKRLSKRPDILLFPDEGKCIIIEFKSPDVNASLHLSQIDFYANLIRNYTFEKFQITAFYGYLIGENIEPRDVLGRVSRYEHSYHFDYLYRPSENVIGFDGRQNGSIYSEVIKFSTLLKRAQLRNKVFIDKLTANS